MKKMERKWEEFALLLIDVQQDFWGKKMEECFPDFPANVARLLGLCRSEGIEVIHLRAMFKPDQTDWMARYRLRGNIPCVEGTPGADTLAFAAEMAGEEVIFKQAFDGFLAPALLPMLQKKGKQFLLTAGLVTSTCVLLTTAAATQQGFLTAVIEDCCADEPFIHATVLERYQFIFERVKVDRIVDSYAKWAGQLKELERHA